MDENVEKKENGKRLRNKLFIVILALTTYIMIVIIGRITNVWNLGFKSESDDTEPENPNIVIPINNGTRPIKPIVTPIVIPSPRSDDTQPDTSNGIITVRDVKTNIEWTKIEDLDIFSGFFYNNSYKHMIAPGFYGTYIFDVENNLGAETTYTIKFIEENEHNVNMVYSIEKDGHYVIGSETKREYINNITLDPVTIPAGSTIRYKLHWKWEDSDNDTEIGELPLARYGIRMLFTATGEEPLQENIPETAK